MAKKFTAKQLLPYHFPTDDQELNDAINAINEGWMNYIIDSHAYQGFNPVVIRYLVRQKIPDAQERLNFLGILICLILKHGSSVFAAHANLIPKAREIMDKAVNVLKLQKNLRGAADPIRTITIWGLVNSFPEIAVMVLKEVPNITRLVSCQTMAAHGYADFPSEFRGAFVMGLIPSSTTGAYVGYTKAILAYCVEEYKVTNSKNNSALNDDHKILDKVIVYAKAAFSREIILPIDRTEFIKKSEIRAETLRTWENVFNNKFVNHINVGNLFGQTSN